LRYIIITAGLTWLLWETMGPAGVVFASPIIGAVVAYLLTRERKSEYY